MDKWTDSHPDALGLPGLLTVCPAEGTHGCRLSARPAPLLAGPTAPGPRLEVAPNPSCLRPALPKPQTRH